MIIKSNTDEIIDFTHDASNYYGQPEAVFFPESVNELKELILELYNNNTCFTICGSRTGLTGGAAAESGVSISTAKLNNIIEVNKQENYIVAECGITLKEIQDIAEANGLLYPPDPTETNCFLGGTIATNASGEKSLKYGATRNFIEELEIILPQGELINIKRNEYFSDNLKINLLVYELNLPDIKMPELKNAAGFFSKRDMDILDLFIGSEGTLGIITKAKIRLIKKPEKIVSCLVFFEKEDDALSFIVDIRRKSLFNRELNNLNDINALALEFMDKNALALLNNNSFPQKDYAAVVWFEQESTAAGEDTLLEKILEFVNIYKISEDSVIFASDEKQVKELKEYRHSFPSKVNEYMSAHKMKKLGTDTAVPSRTFRAYYKYCKDYVESNNLDYVIYGHFGNSHMHLNILPKNNNEYTKAKLAYNHICLKAIELGGTISAEHGIGKLKRELLINMYGEEAVNQMRELKKVLDPKMLLNRGNIFLP